MAATASTSAVAEGQNILTLDSTDRLKSLYPVVNEEETPLPRSWSPKDKYNFIGLSNNNLRVHYKGVGKNHKDAASVRATYPIPASCGIYYFEVKVISKGRDGYMGIGVCAQGVNMNRLPGWDKQSYGYHGDDGHSFCSSGTGKPYGPTFTTGDVIGCCINLIDNTCFYTKNGVNLGIAFRDLPANLYPTVGLQTPGEVVEANFGSTPFIFDIEDYMREWRMKTKTTIERFPVLDRKGEWQTALQRVVSTYLVHHGYCATAESFARNTGQSFEEELASIKNRQRIQRLVLDGRMGEAIDKTQQLYPTLLDQNRNLLFMLKCRQFIEMVNGTDSEVRGSSLHSPRSPCGSSSRSSPSMSPTHHTNHSSHHPPTGGGTGGKDSAGSSPGRSSPHHNKSHTSHSGTGLNSISEEAMNSQNVAMNGNSPGHEGTPRIEDTADDAMDTSDGEIEDGMLLNGSSQYVNGSRCDQPDDEGNNDLMEVECSSRRQLCGGTQAAVERMLQFGRELHAMSEQLKREQGSNTANKKALRDAFSLLAYSDPWSSPVGFQLHPVQREPICAALNSAILESHNLPKTPPLELAIGQASQCMKLMAKAGVGSCAFASVADYLH